MATPRIGLPDVSQGRVPTRFRLLAPVRYLLIHNAEKAFYDFSVPLAVTTVCWVFYVVVEPKPPLFGDAGLLRFARDLLIMAVPFMVGALAAVSMGAPGPHMDRRPIGVEMYLNGELLTMRQFLCQLLGYLSFVGLVTLGAVVVAGLLHDGVIAWTAGNPVMRSVARYGGALVFFALASSLTITTFWSLYFLTDVANRTQSWQNENK